jgi:4-amino-4-deoxy-L-arabinose transferase-like glycosyltransferase
MPPLAERRTAVTAEIVIPRLFHRKLPAFLLAFSIAGCFIGLATRDLCRNESRRAGLAAETFRGGPLVVPTLYGEALLTKPPGMGLAIAVTSWPIGAVTTATARLPSAVAAAFVILLFYRSFARVLGAWAGLAGAVLLTASFHWLDRLPSAEIDMIQLAWVTGAMLFFGRALETAEEGKGPWRELGWWLAALACVSGGFLTKWTAPAFFYLTVVPLLAFRGQWRLLFRLPHLVAAVAALVIGLGWLMLASASAGWQNLFDAICLEALPRLSPAHHPRPYPWAELAVFPLGILLGCLPGAIFAWPAFRPRFAALWDPRTRRLLALFHWWAWVNLLFWTFVPGHRPRHALPIQPALAGLATLGWVAWASGRLNRKPRFAVPLLLTVFVIWGGTKLAYANWFAPQRDAKRKVQERGEQLAALVPANQPLYLFQLKDDGILFYARHPAKRLQDPSHLPNWKGPSFCLLCDSEWQKWPATRPAAMVARLKDEAGKPLFLIRIAN